jgi:hypothetical protein
MNYGKRRSRRSRRRSRRSNRRGKRVSFVTSDGKRVSFIPKRKRSSRRAPSHLKKQNNKMTELSKAYKNGNLGNMSWKSAVKKYLRKGGPKIPSGGRRRSSRRRSSRRR